MSENWKAVFKLGMDEVEKLYAWLDSKWSVDNPCTFRLGHAGRLIIEGKTRDQVFRVSEWIRNQNVLDKKLLYSVIGYNAEGKIIWVSYCHKCRSGKEGEHNEHSGP